MYAEPAKGLFVCRHRQVYLRELPNRDPIGCHIQALPAFAPQTHMRALPCSPCRRPEQRKDATRREMKPGEIGMAQAMQPGCALRLPPLPRQSSTSPKTFS